MEKHSIEIPIENRFAFGKNWAKYLHDIDDERIASASDSLMKMLDIYDFKGKRFLDIGSGSGIFSLVARRLGAIVHSFDFDPESVACTNELKRKYYLEDVLWKIERASILDKVYLDALGNFDIVYSWGVLHHTGAMWEALDNVSSLLKRGGRLYIAIYNDQGRYSTIWKKVKKAYCISPYPIRMIILFFAFTRLWLPTTVRDIIHCKPGNTWRNYHKKGRRGMSPWRDVVDWVGGYPFEVATPDSIFHFYHSKGFRLDNLKTCAGGHGCNEYVFTKVD